MTDISQEIDQLRNAVYGEEVRERREPPDTQFAYLMVVWKRLQSIRQRNGACKC